MRVMLFAFVAIAVLAVGSNLVLREIGFSSAQVNAGQAVRLDDNDKY